MTTLTIGVTAFSVQSAKSTTVFGQLAKLPLHANAAGVMQRASLAKIPRNATITSANIIYRAAAATAGTFTLRAYLLTTAWPAQVTWAKRPARSALAGSVSVTAPANGQVLSIPVTSTVQQLVAGTVPNLGWYLDVSQASTLNVRGTTATSGQPQLVVAYTVPPPVPSNMQPSDADISIDKPVLLFDADPNITALQVQIDPAADESTAFDSGQVAATGGLYDTATSAYLGLADGTSTYWRAQQWTDGGPSGWSPWAQFSRVAAAALTITSPSGTSTPVPVEDGTPPITWTYSGTQVAWQARLLAANGDVLADSGRQLGTDTDWTPPKGFTTAGATGVIEVTAWPDGNRAATPGDPVETIELLDIVLTPNATLEQFVNVAATNTDMSPTVTVTGDRSAIPDFVALLRDGAEVARWPGVDVCVPAAGGGYTATVFDVGPRVNKPCVYALAPVVNGSKGAADDTVSITPRCIGIWLVDADGAQAVLWGSDDADQSQPETAAVHQPIGGTVVRRRLLRAKPQGAVSGQVMDVGGFTAAESETNLRTWADDRDAGDMYTLILGGFTGHVIIGDITFVEVVNDETSNGRVLDVSLNWWGQ